MRNGSGQARFRGGNGAERPDLPNVEAWYGRLRDRAAFRKGVCVPYDELVGKLAF